MYIVKEGDSLSIAWAVVEYIANTKLLGAKTLFATHYHELTELEGKLDSVNNYCIAVKEQGDDIVFLRKIIKGVDGRIFQDCTELIRTDTMRERKHIMEERADAFVIVPGGIGTFEEFFEVFTLKQLERHNKAIAILNVNGYYNAMIDMLEVAVKEKFLRAGCKLLYKVFDDVDETLDYIESYKAPKINVFEMKDVKN